MLRNLLLILVLIGSAMTAFAQADQQAQTGDEERQKSHLYQWTDDTGIVHITDGLGKVPKIYRDKAIRLTQPKKESLGQGRQESGYPPDADEMARAEWRQRIRAAKQRLAAAERRYQELERRRNEALRSWAGAASGRLAGRIEAERIEQEMKDAQREIDEARQDVDVVIPEEARKAGIPPGWLRE